MRITNLCPPGGLIDPLMTLVAFCGAWMVALAVALWSLLRWGLL